ncbi:unnamed protein product (macronuclear) [Paramecium tetraurelia]|uniref:Cyclic nucleotide-binding domain-containing protein n=1 Tax=Paramecium tetraurelia TaxID=5888 RepID=A0DY95_PARTE|nr:uncharacterized protein GSPATT00002980001 [Paramecium tetraurelia]CAK88012.1 unnamed protein product [Paramecium tetraurelia]|eukprot:XP_001455409.1 hypothetical protein (macronuclear) [Paramecium tetraurelia strain d4-2]
MLQTNSNKLNNLEKLIKLLSKSNRDFNENEIILQLLLSYQYFKYFYDILIQHLPLDRIILMMDSLKLETFKENSLIFQEKEPSNSKIYLILSGSVYLLRNKPLQQFQFNSTNSNYYNKYGFIVRELKAGDGFGDKSFLTNQPRSLSAISNEKSQLLILDNSFLKGFESAINQSQHKAKTLIFNFFPSIKLNYSNARLESIFYSFQSIYLARDEILFEEGSKGNEIYILQQGNCMILKKFQNENISIAIQDNNCLFGEEIFFSEKYDYTIKVQSLQSCFLKIKIQDFVTFLPEECKKVLKSHYDTHKNDRFRLYQLAVERYQKQLEAQRLKLESKQSQKLQKQLKMQNYSQSETELQMRFDKDISNFRNFISVRTSSLYFNSTRGFQAQKFNNYSPSFIIDQQYKLLKEPLNPINSPLDFGKGEAEEMRKRTQVQLCVMSMEKINYLNQFKSPKVHQLKNKFLKTFKQQQRKSVSQMSISTALTPKKRLSYFSPEASMMSLANF